MKTVVNATKFALLSMTMLLVFSCNKEEDAIDTLLQDQTLTSTEVKTILETDDYSGVVDTIITDLFQDGLSGKSAKTEECYNVEFSDTGYTITFDSCSVDDSADITGTLTVTYNIGEENSAFTAVYTNLTVGNIVINGTRSFSITNGSQEGNVSFTIVSDMSIKLADDSIIEEMGTKTFAFVLDPNNLENSLLTIDGEWTVTAGGNTYAVNVTSPLKTSFFSCEYIGEGVMSLTKNGLVVSVDFGDGTCDAIAHLTYPDGTVEQISLDD